MFQRGRAVAFYLSMVLYSRKYGMYRTAGNVCEEIIVQFCRLRNFTNVSFTDVFLRYCWVSRVNRMQT